MAIWILKLGELSEGAGLCALMRCGLIARLPPVRWGSSWLGPAINDTAMESSIPPYPGCRQSAAGYRSLPKFEAGPFRFRRGEGQERSLF